MDGYLKICRSKKSIQFRKKSAKIDHHPPILHVSYIHIGVGIMLLRLSSLIDRSTFWFSFSSCDSTRVAGLPVGALGIAFTGPDDELVLPANAEVRR